MSSIKDSEKNDAGNLLPQRRPKLGKYVALAIMLHVAFVFAYLYFIQRKQVDQAKVKASPVKVDPVSPMQQHQPESTGVPSFHTESQALTTPRLMLPPDRLSFISPPPRADIPLMNQLIPVTQSNLINVPVHKKRLSKRETTGKMKNRPEKRLADRSLLFAPLLGGHFAASYPMIPVQHPELSHMSDLNESIGQVKPVQLPVKRRQNLEILDPMRIPVVDPMICSPEKDRPLITRKDKQAAPLEQALPSRNQMTLLNIGRPETQLPVKKPTKSATHRLIEPKKGKVISLQKMHAVALIKPVMKNFVVYMQNPLSARSVGIFDTIDIERANQADFPRLALKAEVRPSAPSQHKPSFQPRTRLIYNQKEPQPSVFMEEPIMREVEWIDEKRQPAATSVLLTKHLMAKLQPKKGSRSVQTSNLHTIIKRLNFIHDLSIGTVRFETSEKATYLKSNMVWKKDIKLPAPISNYAPKQPELPQLIEDHLANAVSRLISPTVQRYSEPIVRILVKNLTYRDQGLESEGTKFLSGLLTAEIEKHAALELLPPSDVSRTPQAVIEGEMWDESENIKVRIWSLDRRSGHRIYTETLTLQRDMVPKKVEIEPPSGENLSLIQRIVKLMKQNFPHGGDFQLGVWPDKGLDAVYLEGESLMVYILPEKDAYLNVDYYQIDGKVVHLLPSQNESNHIKAGASYIIGDPKGGGYEFKVADPFGEELLVVVASQNPLGAITRGLIEPAEPYIKRLAASLASQRKKSLMAGSHFIILTKKRDS